MDDKSKSEQIQRATDGIGAHDGNDWQLKPSTHATKLPQTGFALLYHILTKTPIKNVMREYEDLDALALAEQSKFYFAERWRIRLFFIALAIGAATLLPLEKLLWEGTTQVATFAQFMAILIAIILTIKNRYYDHFNLWRNARAKAELARGRLFREVLYANALVPPGKHQDQELPLALQKLEYVRRHHIELQYAYYCGRGNQHLASEQAKRRWLVFTLAMGLLASLPLFVVGVQLFDEYLGWFSGLATTLRQWQLIIDPNAIWLGRAFLALGIFAAGLEASIANIYRLNNDLSNSLQYHATARRLGSLYQKHLGKVRIAAAENNNDRVRRWFQCCNGLILDEHKKWQAARTARFEPLKSIEELMKRVG